MSQHKAPTAVTIAPTQEKSGFGLWIDRYWKIGFAAVLLLAGWIIYQRHTRTAQLTESQSAWTKVLSVATEDPASGMLAGSPDELRNVERETRGSPAGAWALYLSATSAFANRDFDKAQAALADLRQGYPNHALVTQTFSPDGKAPAESVVKQLGARIEVQRAFMLSHPGLFDNPPLPVDAPRVRLNTDRGPIVVGLYAALAPKLVENFLKLVREGSYSGTKFHLISSGEYIQGGDPNSIVGDSATWGQGGPGYSLDREETPLRHFAGVIAAVPAPKEIGKISGSQFLITTSEVHALDDSHVPFGKILEGLALVLEIERAPLAEKSFNRPKDPVTIQSAEIL
jgi:cyclophilin family peptidyl-prolyl cis-trans isomerase